MKVLLPFLLFAFIFCSACDETETLVYRTEPIALTASAPLFEGSNTAQGQFSVNFSEFLKEKGYENAHSIEAILQKAVLNLPDSLNSDWLSEITLQLAADKVSMQKVGVLNPVPKSQTELTLQTAQEQQKIVELLGQPEVLVVLDANLKKDLDSDWHAQCVLEFLISVHR